MTRALILIFNDKKGFNKFREEKNWTLVGNKRTVPLFRGPSLNFDCCYFLKAGKDSGNDDGDEDWKQPAETLVI